MGETGESQKVPEFQVRETLVTKKDAVRILNGRTFLTALALSAKHTLNTDEETGFSTAIDPHKKPKITRINRGLSDRIDLTMPAVAIFEPDTGGSSAELIDFHFHPNVESIGPSGGDLVRFIVREQQPGQLPIQVAALSAVGKIKPNGDIDLMLLQARGSGITYSDCELYDQAISDSTPQQEIVEALEEMGLNVAILKYTKKGKGYSPDPQALEKISSFHDMKVLIY